MEKSNSHWKAANPLLFISATLLIGVVLGSLFFNQVNKPVDAIVIICIGIILLRGSLFFSIPKWCNGILVLSILMSWGVAIYFATQEKNLIHIPYPVDWVVYCRNWVVQKINATIVSKEANGFALALVLGVKSDLNKQLLQAYSQLGIIHIVAISGMHLEIIFKNLTRITSLLPRKKIFLFIELLLVLGGVWLYTLMAFSSPSIVRASVFFSIYFIGKYFQQSSFTLNTIAGGVLLLLLFDVKNLENLGLQLSYAAVVGIHLFYPLFNKMLPMDNPILAFLWSNLCLSFAAQLTALPILVYHFHQMASMVLVSNFVMVPLSNVLLYSLVILLASPTVFGLSNLLGKWIQQYILWMNACLLNLNSWPISNSFQLHFDKVQMVLYFVGLWLIYRWLSKRQTYYLFQLLILLTGYQILKLFSLV